jgi:hypothetical protein
MLRNERGGLEDADVCILFTVAYEIVGGYGNYGPIGSRQASP